MKKILAAVASVLAITGVAVVASDSVTPPIPVCNGEQATRVLVKWQGTLADSLAPYQAWIDQGVNVQSNSDELLKGTYGHDVMVSLVSTISGGFVGAPHPASQASTTANVTAGDTACSFLPHSSDIYYMPIGGYGDYIFDAGGNDDYWLGGCAKQGEGSPGDRGCDVMVDAGYTDSTGAFAGDRDVTFGYSVPKGRVQRLTGGEGWNHFYVGRGQGRVIVDGRDCFFFDGTSNVPCGPAQKNGDHVHECPRENSVIDFSLELKTYHHITAIDIEYFGPETSPPLDPADVADPCAYQFQTLR